MARAAVFIDGVKVLADGWESATGLAGLRLRGTVPGLVRQLKDHGLAVVLLSNESYLASGRLTRQGLADIHDRLMGLLGKRETKLDGVYYCPDDPQAAVEEFRRDTAWRLPGVEMFKQAAADLDIDLGNSWAVSADPAHAEAAAKVGCRVVRVGTDAQGQGGQLEAADFGHAVELILAALAPPAAAGPQAASVSGAALGNERIEVLLSEAVEQLRLMNRLRRYEDWSLSRLVGTLMQVFALGMGVWAAHDVINLPPLDNMQSVWLRLAGVIVLQLLSLTLAVVSTRGR